MASYIITLLFWKYKSQFFSHHLMLFSHQKKIIWHEFKTEWCLILICFHLFCFYQSFDLATKLLCFNFFKGNLRNSSLRDYFRISAMIFKSQACAIYVIIYIYSSLVIYIYFFIKRTSMVFIALHPHASNRLLKMSVRSLLALQLSCALWSLAWSSDIPVQIWCLSQQLHAPSPKNEARAHQ